jgi:MFS family permease
METNPASNRTGAIALTVAAVALLAVTMGSRSVFGLFLSPLNSATGLGIATISFAVAVSQLAWGAAQPVSGLLAERYGPARVIFAGSLLAAATGALLPFAHSAALLVAVLAAGGVAATVGSPSLLVGTVSQRVAPERRGLVAGIIGAGGPLGQLVLAPATQAVIAAAGWASAAFALAGLSLAALPLALAFRRPAGASADAQAAPRPGASLGEALASPQYWLVNATFFVCGLHVFFLVTHLPGVIELCGLPSAVAGASLAALALFNIAGSIGAGFVIQR